MNEGKTISDAIIKILELEVSVKDLERINNTYKNAILWALGEYQDFPIRRTDIDSQYWWRRELRIRAGMETIAKATETPGGSDE